VYTSLLQDARFFDFLLRCDRELAEAVRVGNCGRCGDKLHGANYPRKPRGGPGADPLIRLSFCCAGEDCRKRHTPPSLRFLGRRVYWGAVFVLIGVMRHGATAAKLQQLRDLIGVSGRTLTRWRTWWLTLFARSSFWKAARASVGAPIPASGLPHELFKRFQGNGEEKLLAFLRFLSPISTGGRTI
jgi:hypothetical protein